MSHDHKNALYEVELSILFDEVTVSSTHDSERQKLLDSIKSIHCIFVHSPEHSEWAKGAAFQWAETMKDLAPDTAISSQDVLIDGSEVEIAQTLAAVHNEYQSHQADRTFIVTPGWWESQEVLSANRRGVLPYKQLFCLPGVPSPLLTSAIGMPQEEFLLGGVYAMPMPSEHYVNSIIGVRPRAKKVCIAYDPQTANSFLRRNLAVQVWELKQLLAEKNIDVVLHHWNSHDMRVSELRNAARDVDSIITLQEPAAAVHKQQLVMVSNAWNVFICASELDSVADGAALGCGVYGATFGIPLARLMFEHLFEPVQSLEHVMGWTLYRIPQQSGMRCNEGAFEDQGIELSDDRMELLHMKSAFDESSIEL
jgi:ABC-type uncharacterized transport system substrate-binding protein